MTTIDVGGRAVRVTNLDKVLWPVSGHTKRFLIEWYTAVAPVLLPHVRGHPVTLHRFPDGALGSHWYETRCPPHPEWIRVQRMPFRRDKTVDACVIDDVPGLVWAAQMGAVELHPYLDAVDRPGEPDVVVFDLDPGYPAGILQAARIADRLRGRLDDLGLVAVVKTSGRLGLHVSVPVGGESYRRTKAFARALAASLVDDAPGAVTDRMARNERAGKVFVDWSQNDAGKSTVAPYSLRGGLTPTVSAPISWDEVGRLARTDADARALDLTPDAVLRRIDDRGDLFAGALTRSQSLP